MIAVGRDEHLRLVAQPAEADRMDDPVAIALERVALAGDDPRRLGMQPAAALRRVARIRGETARDGQSPDSRSTLVLARLVNCMPTMPDLPSMLTKPCASSSVLNGPTSRRLDAFHGEV